MKAVILCNNEGTRLRPVTCSIPKTMLPLMGRPIAEHTLRLFKRHGIKEVVFASDYLSEVIEKHFSTVKIEDVKLDFSRVKNLCDFFDDDTVLINDSTLTDIDLTSIIKIFEKNRSPLLITKREGDDEFGRVYVDSSSAVTKYIRFPDTVHLAGSVFTGIAFIPQGTRTKECTTLPEFAEALIESTKVLAVSPQCYIRNISDFESYHKCSRDFFDKKINLPFPCDEKAPGVWIEDGATVMQGSIIVPPVYIGSGSFISKGARIEAYTQIGKNVNADCFSGVKRSIIMDGASLGEGSSVRGAIIGNNCEIGFESAVYEGSVIGSGTKIGKHCTIRNASHIWPEKYIENESTVCENLIWEKTSPRSLFADGSATGVVNCDITPEFAAMLGRSIVSLSGKKIAVSQDGAPYSSMIKNALLSGIQSAGGKPYDMGEQPLPITRSAIRFYSLDGGVALSSKEHEGNITGSLDIINKCGADIKNEELKKLCNLIDSGEVKREKASKIHETEYLFEYKLYYLKQLINSTTGKELNERLLICCPNLWAKDLLQSAAKDLGCHFTFTTEENYEFYKILKSGFYSFGVIIDYKCEAVTIIKNSGEKISEFDYCALTSLIIMKSFPDAEIFVSESAPQSIELMAEKYSARVHRTKISPPYLMNELSKSDKIQFLHQFIYRFDAVGTIILLLDFLSSKETTIENLLREIPATHTLSTNISYNAEKQPALLKKICESHKITADNSTDAIKINFDNGWVILIPQKTDSAIKVISHAHSMEYAQEISDIFTDEISKN